MATTADPASEFSALPDVPGQVFTAPLQRPPQVGEDWLEPTKRDYSSDDDAIWNALFERQMRYVAENYRDLSGIFTAARN